MDQALLNKLIDPIPGDHPCGEDVSYSTIFDDIREARRQDDPSLQQGEWETTLKTPQWTKVKQLCEDVLQNKSKDLQVVCWYTEALSNLNGFAGLAFGLQILEVLINDFWEFFYPEYDPDDLDERAGKIEWLNNQLAMTVKQIPLTNRESGAYPWLKWDESRTVENIGLKDANAKNKAIADGKLGGEAFDKAVITSGRSFYQVLNGQIQDARAALAAAEKQIDSRFGMQSPGLKELRVALADCDDVVEKFLVKVGGTVKGAPAPQEAEAVSDNSSGGSASGDAVSSAKKMEVGHIRNREDAIAALRQVSLFFKKNEPHSPVALLADRAAKWAEMPLERWLESVIKDSSTLSQLRELLDVPSNN